MEPDIIAQRTLAAAEDPTKYVRVELVRPSPSGHGSEYECRFRITTRTETETRCAFGVDAFQALQLAFVIIGAEIVRIEAAYGESLQFGDGDTGFPRP